MSQTKGMQSLVFENKVYVVSAASIVGKLEGEGPLGKYFDKVEEDPMLGQDSWEEAESRMQLSAPPEWPWTKPAFSRRIFG